MSEDKNSYEAVPTLKKEAAIRNEEDDKRKIIETTDTPCFLSRIGQLRMEFEVNNKSKSYNGTASVFAVDKSKNKVYAVTCAHNFEYFDPIQSKPNKCIAATFERRTTITKGSSQSAKEYKVTDQWIHPQYDSSKAVSQNDLAIIAFQNDDQYFKDLEKMNGLDQDLENEEFTHIYGYPVDKKGELWGQSKKANIEQNKNTNLLQYDIQTTGGQSGSPIIKVTKNTHKMEEISEKAVGYILGAVFVITMYFGRLLGFQSASSFDLGVLLVIITFIGIIYGENNLNMNIIPKKTVTKETKQCNIVGIHTTGNDIGNIGVKLRKETTLKWIKQQIETEDTAHDSDSFYCLKDTPFL